jgi:putative ABC transport system permease protein
MDILLQDLRHGMRKLLRRRGFTAACVLTLALGIGANTAIFSLVRDILIEPLPYDSPDRLVMVWQRAAPSEVTWLSEREVLEYRTATRSFEHVAAYTDFAANLTEGTDPERVVGASVTGNLFDALGVPPVLGRPLTEANDAPGRDDVVMVGWHLWQRRWGGEPDLVGRTIRVNGVPRTVLGVMPPDFRLPLDYREERPTELWIPAAIDPAQDLPWGDRSYHIVARLRSGVSPAAADGDLAAAMRGWCEAGFLDDECTQTPREAVPLDELILGNVRPALLVLFGTVALVLLIACANVANLLLARSDARRREIATQAAIGAARGRLARQLLTETGLIACVGAAIGVALGWGGLRALLAMMPVSVIRMRGVELDPTVLGFTALLAVATTLLAGLAPALELSRADLAALAGAGGRADTAPTRRRVRRGLVVAETALALVLVIGAGLLLRTFVALRAVELGYDTADRLTLQTTLPAGDYPDAASVVGFYEQALARIEELSGVRSAAAARRLPLTSTIGDWSITVEGRPDLASQNPNGDWQVVTPGYVETMNVALVDGRFLTDSDREDAAPVALVNETMAARYWPNGAVGRRFHLGTLDQPWITIVGVTRDVRHNAVIEEPRAEMYIPHAQFPLQTGYAPRGMTIVVWTAGDPTAMTAAVLEQIQAIDPALPVADVRTMDGISGNALAQQRFSAALLGLFAALALALAAIGLYGVVSYAVARRTHELGIRIALGATRAGVIRLVLRESAAMVAAGVALGLLGATALTRLLAGQLYAIAPLDPATFAAVPVALTLVALLASYLPARRAARVSPMEALRE